MDAVQSVGAPEKKWMDFFDNPNAYWDNRQNKRNPRAPDFKHKDEKDTVLWLDSRDTPNCKPFRVPSWLCWKSAASAA